VPIARQGAAAGGAPDEFAPAPAESAADRRAEERAPDHF